MVCSGNMAPSAGWGWFGPLLAQRKGQCKQIALPASQPPQIQPQSCRRVSSKHCSGRWMPHEAPTHNHQSSSRNLWLCSMELFRSCLYSNHIICRFNRTCNHSLSTLGAALTNDCYKYPPTEDLYPPFFHSVSVPAKRKKSRGLFPDEGSEAEMF